jgi:riboflavin synthase
MFTGLIEEIGTLNRITKKGSGIYLTFSAARIMDDLALGDSVNINGVCQTVVELSSNSFSVDTVEETLKKTTLGMLKVNDYVNLERALKANSRLGGHFVLGHIDTTGKINEIKKLSASYMLNIQFPIQFSKYLIPVGSIAVDGISLTLAETEEGNFTIAVIPHTWKETCLKNKKIGDEVNLEFDVLGKYVANLINPKNSSSITEDWLKEKGF